MFLPLLHQVASNVHASNLADLCLNIKLTSNVLLLKCMENLDEIGAQNSSSGGGMESPTELVSSTIHGFPEVKTEQPQQPQQQAVFVLAAPQPPPLPVQQQPQQPQADLYALTLSDGSVVHFKIENNAANATEDVWQQQQPTVSGATSPAPLGAEVTLPFSAPSQTQLSSVACSPQLTPPPPPPPPIMLSHHPQQQELHQALLSIDAAPPSPHHQVSQNYPSTWYRAQVARMLHARPGRSCEPEQEQNSPNLGPAFYAAEPRKSPNPSKTNSNLQMISPHEAMSSVPAGSLGRSKRRNSNHNRKRGRAVSQRTRSSGSTASIAASAVSSEADEEDEEEEDEDDFDDAMSSSAASSCDDADHQVSGEKFRALILKLRWGSKKFFIRWHLNEMKLLP